MSEGVSVTSRLRHVGRAKDSVSRVLAHAARTARAEGTTPYDSRHLQLFLSFVTSVLELHSKGTFATRYCAVIDYNMYLSAVFISPSLDCAHMYTVITSMFTLAISDIECNIVIKYTTMPKYVCDK